MTQLSVHRVAITSQVSKVTQIFAPIFYLLLQIFFVTVFNPWEFAEQIRTRLVNLCHQQNQIQYFKTQMVFKIHSFLSGTCTFVLVHFYSTYLRNCCTENLLNPFLGLWCVCPHRTEHYIFIRYDHLSLFISYEFNMELWLFCSIWLNVL